MPDRVNIEGRATNMPMADITRAGAYRAIRMCLLDPSQIRKMGFGKDGTILDVVKWFDNHISVLENDNG